MIDANVNDAGNLVLTIADDDKPDLADALADYGFWTAFCDAMEPYSCNSSFAPFDAGNGNPFVGLTSAPCIAESLDYADDGTCSIEGRFWYFGDYMLHCPLERLLESGTVTFTLAASE